MAALFGMESTPPATEQSDVLRNYKSQREASHTDDVKMRELFGMEEEDEIEAPEEEKTTAETLISALENTGIPAIGQGLIKATQELGNFAIDVADWTENAIGDGTLIPDDKRMNFADNPEYVYQPDTFAGQAVSAISQFMAPFAALNKAVKGVQFASKIGTLAKAGAVGAAVDFAAFDPKEQRLSNLLETVPSLRNPVTSFLATNPKDTRAEGRLKNALEGVMIGALVDGAVKVFKMYRANRVLKSKMADANKVDEVVNTQGVPEPEAPKVEGEPVTPKEGEPAPTQQADPSEEVVEQVKQERRDAVQKEMEGEPFDELSSDAEAVSVTTKEEADKLVKKVSEITVEEGDRAININMDKMNNSGDAKKIIKQIAEDFAPEIQEARRGVITLEQTKKLATDLGMSLEDLQARGVGQAGNAEEIFAARRLLNASASNLAEMSKLAVGPKATKVAKVKFLKAIDQHRAIQAHVSGLTAEAGRALNAMKLTAGKTTSDQLRLLNDLISKSGGEAGIEKMANRLNDIMARKGTAGASEVIRKSLGRKMADAAYEVWINGLLSGPGTHAINILSNASAVALKPLERGLGRAASMMRGTPIDAVQAGETGAIIQSMYQGFTEGLALAKEAFKTGEPSDVFSKLDGAPAPSIGGHMVEGMQLPGMNKALEASGTLGKALDVIGEIVRSPGRALVSSDEFFKGMHYRMEISAQAAREAAQEGAAKNLSNAEIAALTKKKMANPSEAIHMKALEEARVNTFTKPLDENTLMGVGKNIDAAIKKVPGLRIVAPFVRTNMNIVDFALERNPALAALHPGVRDALASGGAARDMAIGKLSMGAMAMGTFATLSANDIVTGGGPANPETRKMLEATGWKPYSIKIGDKYVSYDRFDPLGGIMGMAADAAEMMGQIQDPDQEQDLNDIVVAGIGLVLSNATPEFMMENIPDYFQVVSDLAEGKPSKTVNRFIANLGGSAIPFSSLLRSIRKEVDPVKRETRAEQESQQPVVEEIFNRIKNTIPGLSSDLPPRRNIWGETVLYETGLGPDIVSPIKMSQAKSDTVVEDEIVRLGIAGPMRDVEAPPGEKFLKVKMPDRYIERGGAKVKLNHEEYDRLVQLSAGKELRAAGGVLLRDNLKEMIQNFTKEESDEMRRVMIKERISVYRKAAKAQLSLETSNIMEGFRQKARENREALLPPN
jgi:hypothetical protein